MRDDPTEAGFTLIETALASALFVLVALAGFEVVRQLGMSAGILAQRADAAAQVSIAAAAMRSDALSSIAVWKPASICGDAVEFMQRDAGGTAFVLYAAQGPALVRAAAAGPLDPCDPALHRQTLIPAIAAFSVAPVAASGLPAHTDAMSGAADGAFFDPAGITDIAADSHANDAAGTPIRSGNGVVEVTIDADPVVTPIDLVAGNRPSGYTHVLAYTCNGRCEATGPFPEIRGGTYTDCASGYDFQNTAAYYVPATYGSVSLGGGKTRIIVTSYSVAGGYTFAFAGSAALAAERAWPIAVWPPPGSPLAGTIADPYPTDYANNAIVTRGVVFLAADLGEPAAFAQALAACDDMHADPTFHG